MTPTRKQVELVNVFDRMVKSPDAMSQLGMAIGLGMAQYNQNAQHATRPGVIQYKETTGLVPSVANIYGRYSIFDPCSPGDIFGLQVQTTGFMQWLGFRSNKFYRRRVDFIPWFGPEGLIAGNATTGAGAPCDDPNGWEYAVCGYDLCHTSWYHRAGNALDPHTIVQDRCETSARYRLNGIQISDDVEWQLNGIQGVMQQDIKRDLIHGNHDNAYQMDGLESIIKEGYQNNNGTTCPQIDSIIVDWAHDDLDGVVNGLGNFFDYLDEVVTEIEWRASAFGTIAEVDMAILTSRFMATCLLDAYACYTTCGVTDTADITDQALRAQQRAMRRELNGGPLYDGATAVGFIHLKSGRRLPILVDDALDIERSGSRYCTDIYLLSRRIGSIDVLYGEYLDLRVYENRVRAKMPDFRARADAAGRFVYKGKEDNWCLELIMGTSPEIYIAAPWAQVRIQDVCCARTRTPIVGDPFQPNYMPGGHPLHQAVTSDNCGENCGGEGSGDEQR
jgi:hypothetical protein